jgi:hypothetical protein
LRNKSGLTLAGDYLHKALYADETNSPRTALRSATNQRPPDRSYAGRIRRRSQDDGTAWEHIYGVDGRERFVSDMHELVTLDGLATILSISFYGSNTIPETGEALLLFGAAVALILFISRRNGRAAN